MNTTAPAKESIEYNQRKPWRSRKYINISLIYNNFVVDNFLNNFLKAFLKVDSSSAFAVWLGK